MAGPRKTNAEGQEELALDEQTLERLAAQDAKSTAQKLKEMKKVEITIPDDPQNPGDQVVPVVFQGELYTVPRGVPVEVPEAIAEIWRDSYTRTRAVNQRIDESTKKEVKVM